MQSVTVELSDEELEGAAGGRNIGTEIGGSPLGGSPLCRLTNCALTNGGGW